MKPTVGRIVHYREVGGPEPLCSAAIVCFVLGEDGTLALRVFGANTVDSGRRAREGTQPGTWHWPEREEPE